jgi:hypothetical protein
MVITVAVRTQADLASQHELEATDAGSNSALPLGSGHRCQPELPSSAAFARSKSQDRGSQ